MCRVMAHDRMVWRKVEKSGEQCIHAVPQRLPGVKGTRQGKALIIATYIHIMNNFFPIIINNAYIVFLLCYFQFRPIWYK